MKIDRATLREEIRTVLKSVNLDGGKSLLNALGYSSDKTLDIPSDPMEFWSLVAPTGSPEGVQIEKWKSAKFLFQLTNDEIPALAAGLSQSLQFDSTYQAGMIESFVFLNIHLEGQSWTRTELSRIARAINQVFPMPTIIIFQHGEFATLAVIDRRINKRDTSKDVLSRKIAVIKDVNLNKPHRAHLEILCDLALSNVGERHVPSNFRELYDAWIKVLDVKELNKKFYNELFDWYQWAIRTTVFPKGQEWDLKQRTAQRSVAVIRLLTRLLFVWFIKEKGLVNEDLFDPKKLKDLLSDSDLKSAKSSSYYRAILQNLFFATLNTEQADRRWMSESSQSSNRLVHSVYRYRDQFKKPEEAIELFRDIPFLNGGLFECLDREITEDDIKRDPSVRNKCVTEGNSLVLRIDGFSNRKENPIHIPNELFFGEDVSVDLGEDARSKKGTSVDGLIEIFNSYKFTIEENTPVDEEVALDPELLGKVFENLLASYDPDTQVSARKQSGSFYTPREVVEFMVDEALLAYLDQIVSGSKDQIIQLLSYKDTGNPFEGDETERLVAAIEALRILDPAVGSGAFPMGMLQKLVHILAKLDPENELWKRQNRRPLERQLADAESIPDPTLRETKVEEAEQELNKLDLAFRNRTYAGYARKLFLIEKCLFGVDIQPIAVTISKLRFFISLAVEQDFNPSLSNSNITPLPNLETKLVAANTLVRIRSGQLALRSEDVDRKEAEIKQATGRHFVARTSKTKRKYRDRVTILRQELADLLVNDGMFQRAEADNLVSWDQFDQNASAAFFDPEWMFGVTDGFHIIIGNPPYGVKFGTEEKKLYSSLYRNQPAQLDSYLLFIERAPELLNHRGILTYIVSNTWLTSITFRGFRKFISKEFGVDVFLVANKDVFDAIVDTHAFVMPRRVLRETDNVTDVYGYGADSIVRINSFNWDRRANKGDPINVMQPEESYELFKRIQKNCKPLSEMFNVFNGVKPFEVGKGTPPQTRTIVTEKPFVVEGDRPSGDHWRPLLRGSLIERYAVRWFENSWIKYGPWLAAPRDASIFDASWKIFVRQTGDRIISCSSEKDFVARDNLHIILPKNNAERADWLVLILNSPVIDFAYQSVNPERGEALAQVKKDHVEHLPIPFIAEDDKQICSHVANLIKVLSSAYPATSELTQFTQLAGGIAYELYFPSELHSAGIELLDELRKRWLLNEDPAVAMTAEAALQEAKVIFQNDHAIFRMLFDLQSLPIVRTIEDES